MSEEIERARPNIVGITLREICYPDGKMERRVDFNIYDLLLALIVIALIALVVNRLIR